LYAGGNFWNLAGNIIPMHGIARWNGMAWDSLGTGVGGNVYSIVKYNGILYAGGSFNIKDSTGNFIQANISYWNGSIWQLPGGLPASSAVWSLKVVGSDLYAGGNFDSIGGIAANRFARFDGFSWHSYPQLGSDVSAIEEYNGEIYVAGDFNAGNGKKDIAKWNGTNWVSVGGGFSGPNSWVNCMTVYQGLLYVGGYFFTSQGDPGNNIASWNGTNWNQLSSGVFPWNVLGMHGFKNELYIGGQINDAGGIPVTFIAKWDGNNWHSLGSNFDNLVECFTSHGNDLYIGGGFFSVNSDTMYFITRYSPPLGVQENILNTNGINITPNPGNGNFYFTSLFYPIEFIRLFDLTGKIIFSKEKFFNNTFECKLNSPDGMYVAEVFVNEKIYRSKLLVIR